MIEGEKRGAWGWEAFAENAVGSDLPSPWRRRPDTLRSQQINSAISGKAGGECCNMLRKIAITSSWAAVCGGRYFPIRKKIIGHDMSAPQRRFAGRSGLQHLRRALALLHQPAREHGAGVLFKPLIEKRADLFTEIGGMVKTREFVALQRGARSREKKLPRRLGLMTGHVSLLQDSVRKITRK